MNIAPTYSILVFSYCNLEVRMLPFTSLYYTLETLQTVWFSLIWFVIIRIKRVSSDVENGVSSVCGYSRRSQDMKRSCKYII
jgi:hypothetical protein